MDEVDPQDLTIGQRVAVLRGRTGLAQHEVAAAAGVSLSWYTKMEQGRRRLDSYRVIHRLAEVLNCSVAEIMGEPHPLPDPALNREHAVIPAIRTALTVEHLGLTPLTPADARPLPELRHDVERAIRTRQNAHLAAFGERAPALLRELRAAAAYLDGEDRGEAHWLLAETYHSTCQLVRKLGYLDLAWMAAEHGREAAKQSDDPMLEVAAAWNLIEVLYKDGKGRAARELTSQTLDQLDPQLGQADRRTWALWGTLHLMAAIGDAQLDRAEDARSHLAEAEQVARRLGEANEYQTMFGPSNVAGFGLAVAVELGDTATAVRLAQQLDLSTVPLIERRSRYLIDVARAHAQVDDDEQVLKALDRADDLAPENVRNHPMVRELVADLTRRERPSYREQLRTLAAHVGVS